MSVDPEFLEQLKNMIKDIKVIKETVSKTDEKIGKFNQKVEELKAENSEPVLMFFI